MTPDQLIYDYLFELSLNAGYTTYDHLPLESENAPYPFKQYRQQLKMQYMDK